MTKTANPLRRTTARADWAHATHEPRFHQGSRKSIFGTSGTPGYVEVRDALVVPLLGKYDEVWAQRFQDVLTERDMLRTIATLGRLTFTWDWLAVHDLPLDTDPLELRRQVDEVLDRTNKLGEWWGGEIDLDLATRQRDERRGAIASGLRASSRKAKPKTARR